MTSHEPAAIIDIGSNSVRLVVYSGPARIPAPIFNEKILAGLGRGLSEFIQKPKQCLVSRYRFVVRGGYSGTRFEAVPTRARLLQNSTPWIRSRKKRRSSLSVGAGKTPFAFALMPASPHEALHFARFAEQS